MTRCIVIICALSALGATAHAACPYRAEDGDTMTVVATGEVIRLKGYDTPETANARCEGERRLGLMAKARLQALVCRGRARVEIVRGEPPEFDRHKRSLARVTVKGRDVAEVMIEEGFARPYNGSIRKGWCSRDSRDDLVPGPEPARAERSTP